MRRWLAHTWADCVYEWRSVRGPRGVVVALASLLALLRVFVAGLPGLGHPLRNMTQDVRFAARRLRQSPVFSAFAVVTLGLSIGATTAVYSLVYAVAFKPPAIADVEQVVNVYHAPGGNAMIMGFSWPDFEDLKARQTSFRKLAAWARFTNAMVLDEGARPFRGEFVDGDYFDVLRVQPQLGRLIQRTDDSRSAPPVVVLSDSVWRSAFASSRDVVGRVVRIGGEPFTVIGVAPAEARGFDTPNLSAPSAWVPIRQRHLLAQAGYVQFLDETDRDNRWVRGVGRLNDGTTLAQASAELRQIGQALDAAAPLGATLDPGYRPPYAVSRPWLAKRLTDIRIHESMSRIAGPVVGTVLVSVALVLLVACTNLANLLLARGASRRQEFSVRMALGGTRWRLMREQTIECAMLALSGGALGLLVTRGLIAVLSTDFTVGDGLAMVIAVRPELNTQVLLLSMGATGLALVTFGLLPAWYSTGGDARSALATDTTGGALPRWRGRRLLIGGQVAVSVALLSVAAVSAGNATRSAFADPGFALDQLAMVTTEPGLSRIPRERALAAMEMARDRIARLPEVDAAALASSLPLGAGGTYVYMQGPERQSERVGLRSIAVSPGYLATIGLPVIEGRDLSVEDSSASEARIVLSARAAERVFGHTKVIGHAVSFTRQVYEEEGPSPTYSARIVGVAGDVDDGSGRELGHEIVYLSLTQIPVHSIVLVARTSGDPDVVAGRLRAAVTDVDGQLAITAVSTGASIADGLTQLLRIVAGTAGSLGGFALVLSVLGLYGVLSFLVARRTREIGLRIALGADRSRVLRLVMADGLKPVLWGLVLGILMAGPVLLNPLSQNMLQTRTGGLPLAALAPVVMLLSALFATWWPARRAARVDPNVALRQQ